MIALQTASDIARTAPFGSRCFRRDLFRVTRLGATGIGCRAGVAIFLQLLCSITPVANGAQRRSIEEAGGAFAARIDAPVSIDVQAVAPDDGAFIEFFTTAGTVRQGFLRAIDERQWTIELGSGGDKSVEFIPSSDIAAAIVKPRPDPRFSAGEVFFSLGILTTNDGQRIPGNFRIQADSVFWEHRWIGAIPFDAERVASISLLEHRTVARSPVSDVILLSNGDSVQGFIGSIGEDIALETLDGDQGGDEAKSGGEKDGSKEAPSTKRIAMDRVAAIAFAESPFERRAGIDIWTSDGSIVSADSLRFDGQKGWSFILGDAWLRGARSADTSDNAAADPLGIVSDRSRFLPLSRISYKVLGVPDRAFRLAPDRALVMDSGDARPLNCAPIRIDGPSSIRFEVPASQEAKGPATLFCEVGLVRPAPPDARARLSIRVGSAEPISIELDAATGMRSLTLKGDFSSNRSVMVEVSDAGNGIAGDRVLLERAFLWFGVSPGGSVGSSPAAK